MMEERQTETDAAIVVQWKVDTPAPDHPASANRHVETEQWMQERDVMTTIRQAMMDARAHVPWKVATPVRGHQVHAPPPVETAQKREAKDVMMAIRQAGMAVRVPVPWKADLRVPEALQAPAQESVETA